MKQSTFVRMIGSSILDKDMQPNDQYRKRLALIKKKGADLGHRYNRGSYIRLGSFIILLAAVIVAAQLNPWMGGGLAIVAIILFGRVMKWHDGLKIKLEETQYVQLINSHELRALENDLAWNDAGKLYENDRHPYQADLDLFSVGGVFQLINRAASRRGKDRLAEWLSTAADAQTIQHRQDAIRELATMMDFRQDFQLAGYQLEEEGHEIDALQAWLAQDEALHQKTGLRFAMILAPVLVLPATLLWATHIGLTSAWLPLLPTAILLYRTRTYIDDLQKAVGPASRLINAYSRYIQIMETYNFTSAYLVKISDIFESEEDKISQKVRRLEYAVSQLNVRDNFFAILFNVFGLWDLHWAWALENHRQSIRTEFDQWVWAVSEIEALCSLATLTHNQPSWNFPQVNDDDVLRATHLGHPLIPSEQRVCNDLEMPMGGHIKLITGSNMAGKSTFLRSVGVNLVLGMAGSVVCARNFIFSPVQVITSMRTRDNLQEGASSFYAELARLKLIIEATAVGPRVYFLLDEILKGTNSADRHLGSRSLILQLLENNGAGLVATHDLALTSLEADHEGQIENWYFDVVINNEKLEFDYRIKRGICNSFNASHLMRSMGFNLRDDES